MLQRRIPIVLTTTTLTVALPAQAKNIFKLPNKPGIAQPYCVDEGQISLNRCAANWFETADFLREKITQDHTVRLSKAETVSFIALQKTWTEFREAHCKLAAFQLEGGSAYPMTFNICRAKLTNDRIADLQKWSPTNRPDLIIFQMLELHEQKLVRNLKQATPELAQYQKGNDLWFKYRTEHCAFERTQAAEAKPQGIFAAKLTTCENRLTQLRSRQIEPLIDLGW